MGIEWSSPLVGGAEEEGMVASERWGKREGAFDRGRAMDRDAAGRKCGEARV